jgi:hypothetical protein
MDFVIKWNTVYCEMDVIEDHASIKTGLLNDEERYQLAKKMLDAVWEMAPNQCGEAESWLGRLMDELGIRAIHDGEAE